jgi:hypothetical protein
MFCCVPSDLRKCIWLSIQHIPTKITKKATAPAAKSHADLGRRIPPKKNPNNPLKHWSIGVIQFDTVPSICEGGLVATSREEGFATGYYNQIASQGRGVVTASTADSAE